MSVDIAGTETIFRGDTPPRHQFQLYEQVTDAPIDLTTYASPEVQVRWYAPGAAVAVLTKTADIEQAETGWVSVTYTAADFTLLPVGTYEARIELGTGSGVWTAVNVLRYRLREELQ